MDLHEDVHRMVESYMDPNEFRRNLNSAIQNSRGVSFLVQKRKAKWQDFDVWYSDWQGRAKQNPILTWGVSARNRVVKEEDLRTLSELRITKYGSRLSEAEDAFIVPPEFTPDDIIAAFQEHRESNQGAATGFVRAQRRWVDDQLPDYELVDALKEMYRGVSRLVKIAHRASGVRECSIGPFRRACVTNVLDDELHCMGYGRPVPDGIYDLATGDRLSVKHEQILADPDLQAIGVERYGAFPARHAADPIQHVVERMEYSRRFLKADGYCGSMIRLNRGDEMRLVGLALVDDEPRELKIATAIESVGAWPFTGAVFASETWLGVPRGSLLGEQSQALLDSNDDFFDASAGAGREEALIVVGLASDGRSRVLIQPFGRTKTKIVWGTLIDDESGAGVPSFLAPIWRNWPQRPSADDGRSVG